MKRLLLRADDLGYSYAVNLGIVRAVKEGLIRSVGLMPNMPEAKRGLSWLEGQDIAIGQHTNVCLGTPCADPATIPSLVDGSGQFKSSRTYRQSFKDGIDFVDYDDAVREIEAQHQRFLELVGHEPDYFEAHAVMSKTLNRAISDVAAAHHLREQKASFDPANKVLCGTTEVRMCCEDMLKPEDYHPADFIRRTAESIEEDGTTVVVLHPGYLDAYILEHSSLTVNRTKEVDALIDPELRSWLEAQPGLQLIDYRDIA
ncbi:MAG: ChbG/HpnK family deacetylase [Atopobiaceae bacterium]|jgi:predicted glycoside hydrolase/deacetylase ChbG (UPF0249 family)|nr:ChbG/HpnK family deacetylase [Atopobiaceae bacterium]